MKNLLILLIFSIALSQIDFEKHVVNNFGNGAEYANYADLDDDGDIDVIATYFGTPNNDGKIFWYENDGEENFTEHIISSSADGAHHIYPKDLDGDGDIDILIQIRNETDKIIWYENDGSENFTKHSILSFDSGNCTTYIYPEDINGDEYIDILFSTDCDYKLAWLENDGSENFTEHIVILSVWGTPYNSQVAGNFVRSDDIDGDGDMDLISVSSIPYGYTGSSGMGGVFWYENDGEENFTQHILDSGVRYSTLHISDLDEDGDIDIITATMNLNSGGNDKIIWFENDGEENFTDHVVTTYVDNPTYIVTGDVNGDGYLDVLASSSYDNLVAWYENDGEENFNQHIVTDLALRGTTINGIDIDEDGDMDILGSSHNDDTIAWYENLMICDDGFDCFGECGGDALLDDCGVCNGQNVDMDCSGVCFGAGNDCNQDGIDDVCEDEYTAGYTAGYDPGFIAGALSGDSNGDGELNIMDIIMYVEMIMNP